MVILPSTLTVGIIVGLILCRPLLAYNSWTASDPYSTLYVWIGALLVGGVSVSLLADIPLVVHLMMCLICSVSVLWGVCALMYVFGRLPPGPEGLAYFGAPLWLSAKAVVLVSAILVLVVVLGVQTNTIRFDQKKYKTSQDDAEEN